MYIKRKCPFPLYGIIVLTIPHLKTVHHTFFYTLYPQLVISHGLVINV